jgi:D-alanyl-D-alanine carboxypeptidase
MLKNTYNKGFGYRRRSKRRFGKKGVSYRTTRYTAPVKNLPTDSFEESTTTLRLVRLIVGIALIAVVVGTVITGSFMFGTPVALEHSEEYSRSEESSSELLRVINKSNPVEKSYVPELVDVDGKVFVNKIAYPSLKAMLDAAQKDNVNLLLDYAYISYDEQARLYKKKFRAYVKKYGLTDVKAEAKTVVTVPQAGRSEFQSGMIVSFKSNEGVKFAYSKAYDWLIRNCINYGFVLRYPPDKTAETSMKANYCAFRYVGAENAVVMRSLNMCLNEYSVYINSRG